MYNFPKGFYSDVRIEDVFNTLLVYTMGNLEQQRVREHKGAFIRLFDGKRWYYASLTDVNDIQNKLDHLASMACFNDNILKDPVVKKLRKTKDKKLIFQDGSVRDIPLSEKKELIETRFSLLSGRPSISYWRVMYIDKNVKKEFYSSKGSELSFDIQKTGTHFSFKMTDGDRTFQESIQSSRDYFTELEATLSTIPEDLDMNERFMKNSSPITPGKYQVILSPKAAGVFAHESFGHKSEADFMLGDETMKNEWALDKKIGPDFLSIVDDGTISGSGYTPWDDEGTPAQKTFLIKDGVLAGRLHNSVTAAFLEEDPTGNGRSLGFEYDPIVRMTSTYIEGGKLSKEELFNLVDDGIFIDSIKHGSGMSTFTIAPSRAYLIKDGKISDPVNISVISGNVFSTLGKIKGVSNEVTVLSFVLGGCGKFEQYPLDVGLGGPYVLVDDMNVQ
ncbi:TldD/PmbA family protein [bacterium]|nr:TldD/PmbA family protein [bacterium]